MPVAWTRLQSKLGAGGTSPATATFSNPLSAGSKLIVAVSTFGAVSATVSNVRDANSNSFTSLASVTYSSNQLSLWAIDTPAADYGVAETISVVFSGGNVVWLMQEVAGLKTGTTAAAMLDGGAAVTDSGSSGTAATGAFTSSTANLYLFSALATAASTTAPTWTVPTGYTADPHSSNSATSNVAISYNESAGAAENGAYSLSVSAHWATIIGAFKAAPYVDQAQPAVVCQAVARGATW